MKVNWEKLIQAVSEGVRLPRKLKKLYLGRKLSKRKLHLLKNSVLLGDPTKDMYQRREILPYTFCPKCGCREEVSVTHFCEWPEHWEDFLCARCGFQVGVIDNSPYYHCLEFDNHKL